MQEACDTTVGAFSRQKSLPWCRRHPDQLDAAGANAAPSPRALRSVWRRQGDDRSLADLLARPSPADALLEGCVWPPRACCRDCRLAAIARRGVRARQRSLRGLGAAVAISVAPDNPGRPLINVSPWAAVSRRSCDTEVFEQPVRRLS